MKTVNETVHSSKLQEYYDDPENVDRKVFRKTDNILNMTNRYDPCFTAGLEWEINLPKGNLLLSLTHSRGTKSIFDNELVGLKKRQSTSICLGYAL